MQTLTILRPDDWHLHLRDGPALAAVLPATARQFARAIVMPNLRPPVTTTAQALAYRERILAARPSGSSFEPLMTLYLTDNTPADEIRRAAASGFVHGVKLYPAGATTNSDSGVTDIRHARPALEAMQRARAAVAGARRGHGRARRRVRPRKGLHRRGAGTAAPRFSGAEGGLRAHHDARSGAVRARRRRRDRRDDHRAPSAATTATRSS